MLYDDATNAELDKQMKIAMDDGDPKSEIYKNAVKAYRKAAAEGTVAHVQESDEALVG